MTKQGVFQHSQFIVFIFFSLSFWLPVRTEAVKSDLVLEAKVSQDKIKIGDRFTYRIKIIYNKKFKLPAAELAKNLQSFEIKDYKIFKPKKGLKRITQEYEYLLTTFTTGEYTILPLTVKYLNEKGEEKEVVSGPIKITVESIPPNESDKDDIRDVKPPVGLKHSFLYYLLWIGLPVLLMAGGIFYYLYKQGKVTSFLNKVIPFLPPEVMAYQRLDELQKMGLIENGETKKYYIILSEIIRAYIERRYEIPVLDRTTGELYNEMRRAEIERTHITLIRDFLEECDLVKFAKYVPGTTAIENDYQTARMIIDKTKPVRVETVVSPEPPAVSH